MHSRHSKDTTPSHLTRQPVVQRDLRLHRMERQVLAHLLRQLQPLDARGVGWRLRVLELDISVEYINGIKNQLAHFLSRLPTSGSTQVDPELNIPVLTVNNIRDREFINKFEYCLLDDEDHLDFITAETPDAKDALCTVEPVSSLTDEKILSHQQTDPLCLLLKKQLARGPSKLYHINDKGILIRVSPQDFSNQFVLPKDLRQRVLYIAHYSKSAGHPQGRE